LSEIVVVNGVIHGDDERIEAWVRKNLGGGKPAGFVALGAEDASGNLAFGAVFTKHLGDDVDMALYATSPAKALRGIIRTVLAYPFDQLGVRRITAEIARDNARCLRFARGIGFEVEGVKRGTERIVMGLLPEDIRI